MQDKNWFKECLTNKELVSKLEKIKLVITDIDGALTDGHMYLTPDRKDPITKKFSIQDGFLINRSIKNGLLKIAFLSGRNDHVTKLRADILEIPEDMCLIGFNHKADKVKLLQERAGVSLQETIMFGDDIVDYNVKDLVGLFVSLQNAPFYIQHSAGLVIPKTSEENAFRLLLDLVLYVQKKHLVQDLITESLES